MPCTILKNAAPLVLAAFATGAVAVASIDPADARRSSRAAVEDVSESTLSGRAAIAVISIKDQRISLYDADGGVVRSAISSGQSGYETPVGVFSILQKKVDHTSNLYDDAQMPFMQRITWSGVALHAGQLPGYPASHGCVRLPYSFAQKIFPLTKLGMRVVISRNDIAPVELSHPLLLKPAPVGDIAVATPTAYQPNSSGDESATILEPDVQSWPQRQTQLEALRAAAAEKSEAAKIAVEHWETLKGELKKRRKERSLVAKRDRAAALLKKAEAQLVKAEERLAKATSERRKKKAEQSKTWAEKQVAKLTDKFEDAKEAAVEADKVITSLTSTIAEAEKAKVAAVEAAAEARRKAMPVSVFISAKTQKLYVRQGNEPVFDAKITVTEPNAEIGTHVFTALDYTNGGNDVRWNVVSISREPVAYEETVAYTYDRRGRKKKVRRTDFTPPVTDADAAVQALERISIPDDIRERVSQYVWPGSSLIISDEELSKETGKGTDNIIVASDEPQGALKIRPREPAPRSYRDYYDDDYYYYRPYRRHRYRPAPSYQPFFWW